MASRETRSLAPDAWTQLIQSLHHDKTPFDVAVEPLEVGGMLLWGIVLIVDARERVVLGKAAHRKAERKAWRQFESAYRFLRENAPFLPTVFVPLHSLS